MCAHIAFERRVPHTGGVNFDDPTSDKRAQFRPTIPGVRTSVFVEQKLTSTDQTIGNYAQAIRALAPAAAGRAGRVFVAAFANALEEAGSALAQWNTDDNPKLMSQMLLACGQANATLFELQTLLQMAVVETPDPIARRTRRMSAIMVGPRLLGLVFSFVRLFNNAELTALVGHLLPHPNDQLFGPVAPVAAILFALRRELDDAAVSPIESHQLKAGAADGNAAIVTMLVHALDSAEAFR